MWVGGLARAGGQALAREGQSERNKNLTLTYNQTLASFHQTDQKTYNI